MWFFIKPKSILKFPADHKIEEFIKVEYSKESNDDFNKTMKKLRELQ